MVPQAKSTHQHVPHQGESSSLLPQGTGTPPSFLDPSGHPGEAGVEVATALHSCGPSVTSEPSAEDLKVSTSKRRAWAFAKPSFVILLWWFQVLATIPVSPSLKGNHPMHFPRPPIFPPAGDQRCSLVPPDPPASQDDSADAARGGGSQGGAARGGAVREVVLRWCRRRVATRGARRVGAVEVDAGRTARGQEGRVRCGHIRCGRHTQFQGFS